MDRTVVVTGASAGIGAQAALQFARLGDHVVLVGRTPSKLAAVADLIGRQTGLQPDQRICDFADLAAVRRTATAIAAAYESIDVLANNAGLIADIRSSTVDGHETTIQVNHLAPFLFTFLLLDPLIAGRARIVTTSSAAHAFGWLDPDDLDFDRRRWSRWRSYADSKQANVLFTTELSWRLRQTGVVATCFHPGLVRSDFGSGSPLFRLAMRAMPVGFVSPSQAASNLLRLATEPAGLAVPGGYFDGATVSRPTSRAVDPGTAERLWARSEELVAG